MSLFGPIRDFFSPPTPPRKTEEGFSLPFGLTAAEWRKLRALTTEEGWDVFVGVLDELVKLDGERILQTSNTETLHFLRGHVEGLRRSVRIIREIELKEQEVGRQRARVTEAGERGRTPGGTLFGSPAWRPPAGGGDA